MVGCRMIRPHIVGVGDTVKFGETVTQWQVFGLVPQMPFAHDGSGVIVLFQVFGQRYFTALKPVFRLVVYYTGYSCTFGITSGE